MIMSFHTLNCPPMFGSNVKTIRTHYTTRWSPSMAMQLSPVLLQWDESGKLHEDKKNSSSGTAQTRCKSSNHLLSQANAVGIIGGASVFSTLIFLEKLVWWSSKTGDECIPFVVCNDPNIGRQLPRHPSLHPAKCKNSVHLNQDTLVENLRSKRVFLEQSGVHCIVMPCHKSHAWLVEVSEGCSVPFLSAAVCVARELKEAKLKPLEAGSNPRIGLLSADTALMIGYYQEQLERQGFEVVLLDKVTTEHTVIPAIGALNRKDMEGARNLLRIAIQVLLVRAVNCVIVASDEFLGVLPRGDPLLKKCVDPMDALARSTIRWAKSTEKIHRARATTFSCCFIGVPKLIYRSQELAKLNKQWSMEPNPIISIDKTSMYSTRTLSDIEIQERLKVFVDAKLTWGSFPDVLGWFPPFLR